LSLSLVEMIEGIATEAVKEKGLSLYDVEYVKEGSQKIIRVTIENLDAYTSIDECSEVSRMISEKLDEIEYDQEEYVLEVSSPGITRALKKKADYERFSGSMVDVSLFTSVEGQKKFTARLVSIEDDKVTFQIDDKTIETEFKNIAKTNIHYDFDL